MSDRSPFTHKTVSIQQACALCGVSRRTIYTWMQSGKVDFVRTAGGHVRIYRETLFHEESVPRGTAESSEVVGGSVKSTQQ